ncbi:protein-L-isoaspartate O-methyltransferase, partial [Candidatus Pacearchaeota archaeon]|nr:protein-L-isoaspartate O-methyltransferase [Candidatus Pacearchaeota archaeon]
KNYKNVKVYNKNGAEGLEEQQPFDRILISAAPEKVPDEILEQLRDGGVLVAPLGPKQLQSLVAIQRNKNKFKVKEEIPGFVFVPFVVP